jgi:hypothetical protein
MKYSIGDRIATQLVDLTIMNALNYKEGVHKSKIQLQATKSALFLSVSTTTNRSSRLST